MSPLITDEEGTRDAQPAVRDLVSLPITARALTDDLLGCIRGLDAGPSVVRVALVLLLTSPEVSAPGQPFVTLSKRARVAAAILHDIDSGMYPAGTTLPNTGELARRHGASSGTVVSALGVLIDEGSVLEEGDLPRTVRVRDPRSSRALALPRLERFAVMVRSGVEDGTYRPGTYLSRVKLARRLGTTRTTAWAVVRRLVGEGVLQFRGHHAYVPGDQAGVTATKPQRASRRRSSDRPPPSGQAADSGQPRPAVLPRDGPGLPADP